MKACGHSMAESMKPIEFSEASKNAAAAGVRKRRSKVTDQGDRSIQSDGRLRESGYGYAGSYEVAVSPTNELQESLHNLSFDL